MLSLFSTVTPHDLVRNMVNYFSTLFATGDTCFCRYGLFLFLGIAYTILFYIDTRIVGEKSKYCSDSPH